MVQSHFFIDITFSETIFKNKIHIKLKQDVKDGFNGLQTPTVFAKCILISQELKDINLDEKTQIDLDGLIHDGKKIVVVNYAQVSISGEDKIAIQLINYRTKCIAVCLAKFRTPYRRQL
jgi:hypothetical protein